MTRTYSKRLLSPFIGVLQVAETPEARALSLDGRNWEVQYAQVSEAQFRIQYPGVDPKLRFFLVATSEEQRQLCERYVNRLAPRLLTLPSLPRDTRRRLEIAACNYVLDVERFHAVYPEVVDDRLLKAARVESQLRRHTSAENH